jgi:hypothetical protein
MILIFAGYFLDDFQGVLGKIIKVNYSVLVDMKFKIPGSGIFFPGGTGSSLHLGNFVF